MDRLQWDDCLDIVRTDYRGVTALTLWTDYRGVTALTVWTDCRGVTALTL